MRMGVYACALPGLVVSKNVSLVRMRGLDSGRRGRNDEFFVGDVYFKTTKVGCLTRGRSHGKRQLRVTWIFRQFASFVFPRRLPTRSLLRVRRAGALAFYMVSLFGGCGDRGRFNSA